MNKKRLGNTSLQVSPLAFGGNVFGWTADETMSMQLLDAFVDGGFNLIDTANVYSAWVPGHAGGESETVIGNWLKKGHMAREKVVIVTKVGISMTDSFDMSKASLKRGAIIQGVEDSLRRLQTDYIDLYLSHIDDEKTPLEETLRAHDELVKAGKVRFIGASNYKKARLEEALKISATNHLASYSVLQPHYNLYHREDYEGELQDFCVANGIGVITYFSLASGFLTGKYRSEADLAGHPRDQMVKDMLNERGLSILATLDDVAAELDARPSQVALAWLAAQPGVVAPITSATSMAQLQEIMGCAALSLNADQIRRLNDSIKVSKGSIKGVRVT
ncbi:MAG: aldo/keto reductase [Pseudomonadales bacterium]|nr:aldo/keto reductase [Pseudomonadales bacterium]